eukprot:2544780-Amphidinium_carterae.1
MMCHSPDSLSNRAEQQMIFGGIEGLERSVLSPSRPAPLASPAQTPEGRRSHVTAAYRSSTPTQSMELCSLWLAGKAGLPNMFEVTSTDADSDAGEHVMFESDATDSWELKFPRSGVLDEEDGTDSWELHVKNTFLHVNEEMTAAPSIRRNSMERSKSLPPLFAPRRGMQEGGCPSSPAMSCADTNDAADAEEDDGLEPLAETTTIRQPSWSIGSEKHGTGSCKPCAWYYKSAQGCQNGEECMHCHLCPL